MLTWLNIKAEGAIKTLSTPLPIKEAAWQVIRFVIACGKSHPVSFALRPIANNAYLRLATGGGMAGLAIYLSMVSPISLGADSGGVFSLEAVSDGEVQIATAETVQNPVEFFRLTQKYRWLHTGLDMAAPIGTPVKPVMAGKVVKTEKNWYGYGNLVRIDHGNGYESWYAHLSKIEVKEGQEVDLETELGKVGSTGRSTGPHLHLEIHENGKTVNPGPILGI
jgi:hypothetical protein